MVSKFGTWWQIIKRHPFITAGIVAALLAIIAFTLSVHVFDWDWTGFTGGESKITKTPQGTITEYSPGKNLWDWMQLLLIPILLAIGGFWLNQIQKSREEKRTERHDKTEREIAIDNQQEVALQAYLDTMSELLLEKHLRKTKPEDEVRMIARVRTLSILSRLDEYRKRSVLQFLYECGLIDNAKPIVDLSEADLSRAELIGVGPVGANLSGTVLSKANLAGATLRGVNLSRAVLNEADLSFADLREADLSYAILIGADLQGTDLH